DPLRVGWLPEVEVVLGGHEPTEFPMEPGVRDPDLGRQLNALSVRRRDSTPRSPRSNPPRSYRPQLPCAPPGITRYLVPYEKAGALHRETCIGAPPCNAVACAPPFVAPARLLTLLHRVCPLSEQRVS